MLGFLLAYVIAGSFVALYVVARFPRAAAGEPAYPLKRVLQFGLTLVAIWPLAVPVAVGGLVSQARQWRAARRELRARREATERRWRSMFAGKQ